MITSTSYGGWIPSRPEATGVTPSLVRTVGWMTAAITALTVIGTGGELSLGTLQNSIQQARHQVSSSKVAEIEMPRTPSENLSRIRTVLKPAISDLANIFDVSRQTIYNWLNGETLADENATKLKDLAEAIDILLHGGVTINSALLKRKFANGRTLLQVVQIGESARDAALKLVHIHKHELLQRERLTARFANRAKTPVSSDFDLPAFNDHV